MHEYLEYLSKNTQSVSPQEPRQSRVAIVTGASSGIGRTTAIALCEAGWNVILSARRESELQETARLCVEARGDKPKEKATLVVPGDVTKEEDVRNLFIRAVNEYGTYSETHQANN